MSAAVAIPRAFVDAVAAFIGAEIAAEEVIAQLADATRIIPVTELAVGDKIAGEKRKWHEVTKVTPMVRGCRNVHVEARGIGHTLCYDICGTVRVS